MTRAAAAGDVGNRITPVVLTLNETPNIGRTLENLAWAARVVVVDSGSTDGTDDIARAFPNVAWYSRRFDTHAGQWAYALSQTSIQTPYVLALDADYRVPPAFVEECAARFVPGEYDGGIAAFDYEVLGRRLLGSIYPAKPVIFRPSSMTIDQPGHSQEIAVQGRMYTFETHLVHDDRKPVSRFVTSQIEYSRLEALRLAGSGRRWQDRVRRMGLMPAVAGIAAYVRAGGPFKGTAALRYAYERVLFECVLAMRVLEASTSKPLAGQPPAGSRDGNDATT